MAFSAVTTSTRWCGPTTRPEPRARRVTVASSTLIESGNATGASWWLVKIIPRLRAQPVGEMFMPACGPAVWSRCQSPQ